MALGFLVMLSGRGIAKDRHGSHGEPGLKITVHVQDYAQVAPKILTQAKREAEAILDETGVETLWVDCPPGGRPTEAVCTQTFAATDLALRILPQAMAAQVPLNGDVFGFAAVSTDERPSLVASAFYHQVEALSDSLGYSRAATLGYVMAHEIGHLLLGTNSHSPRGIMRARLTKEDFLRPLGFSPAQAELILAEVGRRVAVTASAEAARTVQPAPNDATATLTIELHVYDYAGVEAGELARAQTEPARVLQQIGIAVTWINCVVSAKDATSAKACPSADGQAPALVLRILPRAMAERATRDKGLLGFAQLAEDGASASVAFVFYHRVESLAAELRCARGVILGYALAHEVGHLLLGVNSHSPAGIMCARWTEKELRLASTGWFGFFPQQAAKMRADVRKRITAAASAEASRTVDAASR